MGPPGAPAVPIRFPWDVGPEAGDLGSQPGGGMSQRAGGNAPLCRRLLSGTMGLQMSTAPTAAPASGRTGQRQRLRLLVGVHDGTLSGVNTYIEHVAAAASSQLDDVTLLVAGDALAVEVASDLAGTGVRVVSLGMEPLTPWQRRRERLSPMYAAHRLAAAVAAARPRIGEGFDAAHLNHPHLAAAVRPVAGKVFVAAWFHPHSLSGRALGTWRNGGRRSPRTAVLVVKGLLHHANDARGFRAADTIVAPTRALTEQLRRAGFDAVHCVPPARVLGGPVAPSSRPSGSAPRLLVCSGDLGHPRKNVALALQAVAILADQRQEVDLELVGGNAEALRGHLNRLPPRVRVRLSRRLPAADVHARMGRADALLFPSLFEEWGFVAVEAALQGTPVVTLPVYPFDEMLVPPIGFRAGGATAAEYADAIADALASTVERPAVAALAERRFGLARAGRSLAAIWGGDLPDEPLP